VEATCNEVNDEDLRDNIDALGMPYWCDYRRGRFISSRVELVIADLINPLFGADSIAAEQ
jgi:hypothetical protein